MVLMDWLKEKNAQKVLNATPSELIEMAISDLEKCEKQKKKYRIAMGEWHNPNHQCAVCIAGAVMAQTLKAPTTIALGPGDFEHNLGARLTALDDARSGRIWLFLERLKHTRKISRVMDTLTKTHQMAGGQMVVTTYAVDADLFKEQMHDIARACRKAGI